LGLSSFGGSKGVPVSASYSFFSFSKASTAGVMDSFGALSALSLRISSPLAAIAATNASTPLLLLLLLLPVPPLLLLLLAQMRVLVAARRQKGATRLVAAAAAAKAAAVEGGARVSPAVVAACR